MTLEDNLHVPPYSAVQGITRDDIVVVAHYAMVSHDIMTWYVGLCRVITTYLELWHGTTWHLQLTQLDISADIHLNVTRTWTGR
jgi:hypothetical protein